MAAYAAVVSVMNIMEQIRNHPRLSASFDDNQIVSLGEHLDILLEYVESYSHLGGAREAAEDLERRIASAAHAAEDVIETYVLDQIQAGFAEESPIIMVYLEKIIEEMSLIKEEVAEVKEGIPEHVRKAANSAAESVAPYGRLAIDMVGYDKELDELLERLTEYDPKLNILAVHGPSGLGKTTLARNAYTHPLVKEHFDYRAWANAFSDYDIGGIILQLLSCLGRSTSTLVNISEDELLGQELYKTLSGSRYLIVLDGMWSIIAWERIKDFFPENNIGSRIIATTGLFSFASRVSRYRHDIKSLDDSDSWKLFCVTAFGDESSPDELEAIGREIASYCNGHPLLISVIGGFLGKSSNTQEFWEYVAKRIGSNHNQDFVVQFHTIFVFCYDALPTCLKPCLLYMSIFPEHSEISVSRVIKLWIAEGFLKPKKGFTLEEVGENCILELIHRNLIYVSSTGSNGQPKLCKINNSLRELCTLMVDREKFFSFVYSSSSPRRIQSDRRFVTHDDDRVHFVDPEDSRALESALYARSLICARSDPALMSCKSLLLRVLVEVYVDSLEASFEQVNLRFLAYESIHAQTDWMESYELPSSISLLWNVQTLILGKKIEVLFAPSEIWEMPTIRHLHFYRIHLPDLPPACDDEDEDGSIMQNLQTLGTVLNLDCSEEVCKRMPNVKKLRVFYDELLGEEGERKYWFSLFTKLESLNCCFLIVPNRDDLVRNLKFPSSLKKLVLQDCELHWSDLSIIGSLPFLEVLKLKCQSVQGPRWETVEGGFVRLKFLEIDSCYLIYWTGDESHFPVLEKLVLRRLKRLKEIPSKIGEIPTLKEVSAVECSISAAMSAARFNRVRVRVGFRKEEEVEEFNANMKSDGLDSSTLQIHVV